ncbi:MAG: F0F1 ATP synthase subunit gamma, partial [Erysipelotrichaceae bacterium]|nr:F0F1 ATP synthase subunit gamma [Erysipelotrichaceae bacterium]
MAGTKEIKDRISSVRETQQITNAMYLIASMKMRKAKRELDGTRPYFDAVSKEIKRIFRTAEKVRSQYFYQSEEESEKEGTDGLLVITADKGMAGAYNQNVLKKAEEILKKNPDTKLFVVGEFGRQYFLRRNIPVEQNFLYTAQ